MIKATIAGVTKEIDSVKGTDINGNIVTIPLTEEYTGTKNITENGTYDVGGYASIDVNIDSHSGGSDTNPFSDCSDNNISGFINKAINASKSGEFKYASVSTTETTIFDTGLGSNLKGFLIINKNDPKTEENYEGISILCVNVETGKMCGIVDKGAAISGAGVLFGSIGPLNGRGAFTITEGKINYSAPYNGNNKYSAFDIDATYKWFAW